MAQNNSLKVMYLFEAGARLHCGAETLCLAAHLYHRFFRLKPELNQYDMLTFGSGCIKLAHWFYEKPICSGDLALIMSSISHGKNYSLEEELKNKLEQSIDFASQIIAIHLEFQINYKDTRMATPGEVLGTGKQKDLVETIELESCPSDYEIDDEAEDVLTNTCKHNISSHRYLVHYLNCIKLLVSPTEEDKFKKVCNIAWSILSDFHWLPHVTQHYSNHLACASLMMSISICIPEFESSNDTELCSLLNKKWNLIFCDDFSNERLERLHIVILQDYEEYERVLQHEFSTYVIDPKNSESNKRV